MSATQKAVTGESIASRIQRTPWGEADSIDEIGRGIFFASTPGHGGYYVPSKLLGAIPEAHQQRAEYWSGSRNWYEEDCEWASVAIAFPDLFSASMLEAATATLQWRDNRPSTQKGAR